MPRTVSEDRWDSSLYDDRHSFVWKGGAGLVEMLNPKPGERVLDIGCGTGHLTARIAESGAEVVGFDSSVSMIAQARQNFPKVKFHLADASDFDFDSPFDAAFSNAVLHWIPQADKPVQAVARALKPGGRFVLEFGGKGNTARVIEGVEGALRAAGYPAEHPWWYYPSVAEYATVLERHGFEIRSAETFPRWSRLEHPERGLREWLEMFGSRWFEPVPPDARETLLREIETRLRPVLWKDGAWHIDYRRLRVAAEKF